MNIKRMNIKQSISSAIAVMVAAVCGSHAQADHDYGILEAKADALFTVTQELDRTFVRSYVRSRLFGEIMATSGQIKAKSVHLRVMAKHGTPCDWAYEVKALDDLVCRLKSIG